MRALIFHIILAVCLLPSLAVAADNWCRPSAVPSVNVQSDTDRITWIFSKSEKSLDTRDIDTVNPYGNNVITDVGGLMQGGIKMTERMQFGSLTNPNIGQVCMFFTSVDIGFHIFPTIFIASEFLPGSCMHNAIKEHELKHISTDRDIVNRYATAVGQALQAEVGRQSVYGPVPVANQQALQSQMQGNIARIMTSYGAAMDAERRARQQTVDSLQEYERVNHLCDRYK